MTKQINVRIDEDTASQLAELEARTDIDAARLVRHAIKAALRHWQEHRELRLPLVCIPEKDYEALIAQLPKSGSNVEKKRNRS